MIPVKGIAGFPRTVSVCTFYTEGSICKIQLLMIIIYYDDNVVFKDNWSINLAVNDQLPLKPYDRGKSIG